MSKKTKLTLAEIAVLKLDLQALRKENLTLSVKMDVSSFLTSLEPIVKDYNEQVTDFFKKYGKDEGNERYTLPKNLAKEKMDELNDLNKKEEEIVCKLKFDTFKDITSDYPYEVFLKLFE